jgi:hypothetical protein
MMLPQPLDGYCSGHVADMSGATLGRHPWPMTSSSRRGTGSLARRRRRYRRWGRSSACFRSRAPGAGPAGCARRRGQ